MLIRRIKCFVFIFWVQISLRSVLPSQAGHKTLCSWRDFHPGNNEYSLFLFCVMARIVWSNIEISHKSNLIYLRQSKGILHSAVLDMQNVGIVLTRMVLIQRAAQSGSKQLRYCINENEMKATKTNKNENMNFEHCS